MKQYTFPANAPYRRFMALAAFLLMAVAAGGALFELTYFLIIQYIPRAIIGFFRYSLLAGAGFVLVMWEKKHRADESVDWLLLPSYVVLGTSLFGVLLSTAISFAAEELVWLLFGAGAVVALYILTTKGVLKTKLPLLISSLVVPALLLTRMLVDMIKCLAYINFVGLVIVSYSAAHLVLLGLFLVIAVVSLKEGDEAPAAEAPVAEAAPVTEAPAAETKRFCTACGTPLPGDTAFCTQCGQRVN